VLDLSLAEPGLGGLARGDEPVLALSRPRDRFVALHGLAGHLIGRCVTPSVG
jgi:hypothetical protein